jgi:hypothetical protein
MISSINSGANVYKNISVGYMRLLRASLWSSQLSTRARALFGSGDGGATVAAKTRLRSPDLVLYE